MIVMVLARMMMLMLIMRIKMMTQCFVVIFVDIDPLSKDLLIRQMGNGHLACIQHKLVMMVMMMQKKKRFSYVS